MGTPALLRRRRAERADAFLRENARVTAAQIGERLGRMADSKRKEAPPGDGRARVGQGWGRRPVDPCMTARELGRLVSRTGNAVIHGLRDLCRVLRRSCWTWEREDAVRKVPERRRET